MKREQLVAMLTGAAVTGGVACLIAVGVLAGPWIAALAVIGAAMIALAASEAG